MRNSVTEDALSPTMQLKVTFHVCAIVTTVFVVAIIWISDVHPGETSVSWVVGSSQLEIIRNDALVSVLYLLAKTHDSCPSKAYDQESHDVPSRSIISK
jgi:hypothetical protein